MSDSTVVEDSIKHSIKKNGFPERVVRLPFKAVYESCKRNNTTLKNVLDSLIKSKIIGTIQGDHIEFCSPDNPAPKTDTRAQPDNTSWMNGLPNLGSLEETAQSYMSKMTPEQIAEIRKTIENMSDEEKQNIVKTLTQQFNPKNR
ncbi:MAG: hypothetical protein QF732_03610 [Nitrospinaceae bacterium]|jgi:hypothetical protein|nr:hypothetical protein [Nitrospinaceae bacterium]